MYPDFEDKSPDVIHEPLPLSVSPYSILSTEDELQSLITTLKQTRMIGFDLRQHTYRSYLGFICVISVSSFYDFDT